MKFEELPLYIAVNAVRKSIEQPGSDDWVHGRSSELYLRVIECLILNHGYVAGLPDWSTVKETWINLRKVPKSRTIAEVAEQYSPKCFYSSRVETPCSDDVACDRLLPGSRGGEYDIKNCVIPCGHHNSSRGDKTIEEFLSA